MKRLIKSILSCLLVFSLFGCSKQEKVTLQIAAASSLKDCMEEIYTVYQEEHNVDFEGVYDGSGKLQIQIEEGLNVDLFISASTIQMDTLQEEGLVEDVENLLENKLVLITNTVTDVTSLKDIDKASIIAIGDPDSVPAGQYAKIALGNQYDSLISKLSLGSNVTEVLSWVESESAEVGFVYASDVDNVKVIEEIDLDTPIVYPMGIIKSTIHKEEIKEFIEFLKSDTCISIFEKYGFKGV